MPDGRSGTVPDASSTSGPAPARASRSSVSRSCLGQPRRLGPERQLPDGETGPACCEGHSSCSALTRSALDLHPDQLPLDRPPTSSARCRRPPLARLRPNTRANRSTPAAGPDLGPPGPDRTGRARRSPGRPFFITTGATQASWAPASRRAKTAWASCSPVTSSTVTSRTATVCPASASKSATAPDRRRRRHRSARHPPVTTWVQFGSSSSSREPAPTPGPTPSWPAWAVPRGSGRRAGAAPVGVVSSTDTSGPRSGPPEQGHDGGGRIREHAMGGPDHAGPGGHRTGPDLVDAEHLQAAAVPDHVDDGVVAPTSWKWTWSTGRRWNPVSTSASTEKVDSARRATRSGRRASSTRPTMWAWVRTTTWSWTRHDGPAGGDPTV